MPRPQEWECCFSYLGSIPWAGCEFLWALILSSVKMRIYCWPRMVIPQLLGISKRLHKELGMQWHWQNIIYGLISVEHHRWFYICIVFLMHNGSGRVRPDPLRLCVQVFFLPEWFSPYNSGVRGLGDGIPRTTSYFLITGQVLLREGTLLSEYDLNFHKFLTWKQRKIFFLSDWPRTSTVARNFHP